MLWSLLKFVLFFCAVALAAMGAHILLHSQGSTRIGFEGFEITLSPLQTVIAVLALMFAIWLLIKFLGILSAVWRFLNGDETAFSRYFERNRQSKGFDALAQGMMALASGEGRTAMAKAARAEKYLKRPELTNLLTAQAAEMAGDRKKAEETYRALIKDEKTRFIGLRGILQQRLAEGDSEVALQLAQKAFDLKPQHEDTQDVLLKLQSQAEDWSGARQTLNAKLKFGTMPREVHRRRDAVLALSQARGVFDEDVPIKAREAAIEANRLSPDLIPAAVLAAQSYLEQGEKKYASRVLKKAWSISPHPDLSAVFAEIEPDETTAERLKRFNSLIKGTLDHAETKMLLCELHLANEDFPAARRVLGDLFETEPTARLATLFAAIERGEGADDTVVKGWLTRALSLPRGPQWLCDNCQHIHSQWAPSCEHCESFDTLSWKTPPQTEVAIPGALQMLPLIVGESARDLSPEVIEDLDVQEVIETQSPPSQNPEAHEEPKE